MHYPISALEEIIKGCQNDKTLGHPHLIIPNYRDLMKLCCYLLVRKAGVSGWYDHILNSMFYTNITTIV